MEILAPYNGEIEQIRFAPEAEYPKFALLIKFRDIPVEPPLPGKVLEVHVARGQFVTGSELLMTVECGKEKVGNLLGCLC